MGAEKPKKSPVQKLTKDKIQTIKAMKKSAFLFFLAFVAGQAPGIAQMTPTDFFPFMEHSLIYGKSIRFEKKDIQTYYRAIKNPDTLRSRTFLTNAYRICIDNRHIPKTKKLVQASLEQLIFNCRNSACDLDFEVNALFVELMQPDLMNGKTKRLLKQICRDDYLYRSVLLPLASKTSSRACLQKIKNRFEDIASKKKVRLSDQEIAELGMLVKQGDSLAYRFVVEQIRTCQRVDDRTALQQIVDGLALIGGEAITNIVIDEVLMSDWELISGDYESSDYSIGYVAINRLITNLKNDRSLQVSLLDDDPEVSKKLMRDWVQKNRKNFNYRN